MAIAKRNLNLDQNPNLKRTKKVWNGTIDFPKNYNISNSVNDILVGDLLIWKGQKLSQDFLRTKNEDEREEIAKDIYNFAIEYDWSKLRFSDADIKSAWRSLCDFKIKTDIKDGVTYISNSSTSGNKIYRQYFPNILKVRGNDRKSVYDVLTDKEFLWKTIYNRVGLTLLFNDDTVNGIPVQYPMNINVSQLTIGAKNSGFASMGSSFKPSVAKAIYNKYVKNGDKVLDYSCGFGTRLLGLMSLKRNNSYCGYEPNTETYNNLLKMSSDFRFNTEIKCCGSETELFDHKFNFIFSSPPYHTSERYCDEESQCYNKYPEYNQWLDMYWRKTVENCIEMLAEDGVFAVNIGGMSNEKMQKMTDDMTAIVEEKMVLVDKWFMVTSKSHLSSKRGDKEKVSKLEGIYFYKSK